MIVLVASKMDIAAINIAEQLIKNHGFNKTLEDFDGNPIYQKELESGETARLIFIEQESVSTQSLAFPSPMRLLVFVSRQ